MASSEITVRVKLADIKGLAMLAAIGLKADAIVEDQPWNDDAKQIRRIVKRLLKRIETKKVR